MSGSTKITVNQIFAEYSDQYIEKYCPSDYEKKIIRAITSCRTEKLGGRIEECNHCHHQITLYNSCRNRHCPLCQFLKKEQWVLDKTSEVLPYQYFHVVFTIPHDFNKLIFMNKKRLYLFLFETVKKTLLEVTGDDDYFGANIGYFAILHTWGQKLNLHPHIHCVVPGGGYDPKKKKWKSASKDYLVPVDVLKPKFKYNFVTDLRKLYKNGELKVQDSIYQEPKVFKRMTQKAYKKDWVVYLKETFNKPESVIKYLSRYTHKIAISNYRIKKIEDGFVYFTYRNYKNGNKKEIHRLKILSFMRHFLLHIVPERFVRIRYYGLLSHRNKKKAIEECCHYYGLKQARKEERSGWIELYQKLTGIDLILCSICNKGMMVTIKTMNSYRAPPG
jgi:hypothetical protein